MTRYFLRACGVVGILALATVRMPAAAPGNDFHGDPLPEGAVARLGTVRLRHGDVGLRTVLYSPDGKLLASTCRDRSLRIWDAATGRQVHVLQEKDTDYYAVAWAPNGLTLAISSGDPVKGSNIAVRLMEVETFKEIKHITGHDQPANELAFTPDGKILLSVSLNRVIRWNAVSGDKLSEWPLLPTAALAFSPDRSIVAWVDGQIEGKTVHLSDAATGKEVGRLKGGHEQAIVSVAFSPDGKLIASGNPHEPIQLWDRAAGSIIRVIEQQQAGIALKFSADGKALASGTMDGSVRLWEVASAKELPKLSGYRGWVNALAFTPDSKTLALAGSESQIIYLWDVATAKECPVAGGHHGQIYAVAYSPDGRLMATGGGDYHDNDETVFIWDTATGKEVRRLVGHRGKVYTLQFSPDGKRLVSGSEKEECFRVWDTVTGKQQEAFQRKVVQGDQPTEYRVTAVAWSPNGEILASAHDQGELILWDAQTGAELRACEGHEGVIHSLAFSPEGKWLISGGVDRVVRMWRTATGKSERQFGELQDGVKCVAYSPDGRLVAASSGDYDGVHLIWEASSGRELAKIPAIKGRVYQLAFSPDGKLLAGTGADNALCVWEVATQTERCRFPGHPSGSLAIAFSPDGKTLASGSQDTTVLLWDVTHCPNLIVPTTEKDLDRLWAELGSTDVTAAHRAICTLLACPDKALKLIDQHLHPFSTMNTEQMARALDDLDSERFVIRERATSELARLGELAEPLLRDTLDRQPSPEVRKRVQLLLGKLEASHPAADQLRALRAFEVLERIGGTDARAVFEAQLQKMPDGRLGREAQASLNRMRKR